MGRYNRRAENTEGPRWRFDESSNITQFGYAIQFLLVVGLIVFMIILL